MLLCDHITPEVLLPLLQQCSKAVPREVAAGSPIAPAHSALHLLLLLVLPPVSLILTRQWPFTEVAASVGTSHAPSPSRIPASAANPAASAASA